MATTSFSMLASSSSVILMPFEAFTSFILIANIRNLEFGTLLYFDGKMSIQIGGYTILRSIFNNRSSNNGFIGVVDYCASNLHLLTRAVAEINRTSAVDANPRNIALLFCFSHKFKFLFDFVYIFL